MKQHKVIRWAHYIPGLLTFFLSASVWRVSVWGSEVDTEVSSKRKPLAETTVKKLDGLFEEAIAANKMPGCVVLIGQQHGPTFLKAYGYKALLPEREVMTEDTIFDLASLTKPIATATSVMKLEEQGRITLDQPVSLLIPEFANNGKETITIRDLLVHRSGLIADNPLSDYADGYDKSIQRLLTLKLSYPVGSRFVYSDVNFMILGKIVEHVSGQNLKQFTTTRLFDDLGMKETRFLPDASFVTRIAPTEQREGRWIRGEVHDPRAFRLNGIAGHAGLFGTARDLARYCEDALAGINVDQSKILKQQTWQKMVAPYTISGVDAKGNAIVDVRGLGWDIKSRYSANRGQGFSDKAFGHGGFTGTAVWIDPVREVYSIFLSNRVHPNGKGLVNPIIGQMNELIIEGLSE